MTTKQLPERTIKTLPEAIVAGILAGHIEHFIEKVTIKAATSPTKKDEAQEFDALYALDAEGMVILSGGKVEPKTAAPESGKDERTAEQKALGACDHFNYGRLLGIRQNVRTDLESTLEGPEKSIEKAVKANMAAGLFDTEQETREFVVAQMKKNGKLPADYTSK